MVDRRIRSKILFKKGTNRVVFVVILVAGKSLFEKVVILSWVRVMRWSDGCMEGKLNRPGFSGGRFV